MLKKILLGLSIVIVALVIVVATRPSDFRVTRSAVIPAPASLVFPYLNDLQKWQTWSPWAALDPECKNTFEGPVAGPGAKLSWAGNSEVGEGTLTITESKPTDFVRYKLHFIKPMEGDCENELTLKPEGGATHLTWTMTGRNNFVGKAIGLFMDCDKMCGDQFEQGFANLKGVLGGAR